MENGVSSQPRLLTLTLPQRQSWFPRSKETKRYSLGPLGECRFPIFPMTTTPSATEVTPSDFIRDVVAADVRTENFPQIHTRFPPEPNGYLHIGHAKSICLNFGLAKEFNGVCNLRMDDTNPTKEESEYVESIQADVTWLVRGWADHVLGLKANGQAPAESALESEPFYASDYFDQMFEYASELIAKGKAYVDDLSPKDTDNYRIAGKESPFRGRSPDENRALFDQMRFGAFPDGTRTLRAKIDMQAPNVWLRDPILYRIRHAAHHRTGNRWCIYPMYDFAHCLSDYLEGITHSICTLEFEVHRPLYEWILQNLELPRRIPHQYEFARLNLTYTVLSKRKLMQLVEEGLVSGWDDPRLPTISGMRRRGVTASALRTFAYHIGITKYDGVTDVAVLEHAIRDELNKTALRRLAVLRPIKVVLTNYPELQTEELNAVNNPEDPTGGTRKIEFGREIYIESDDFMESPPAKYFRLRPGGEVRLKYGYIIKCDEVVKNSAGEVLELRCTADLESKSGGANANRKIKGTIHWVSAKQSIEAEVRLHDRLFTEPEPEAVTDFKSCLNPHSLEIVRARCEASLGAAQGEIRYQFERLGYFAMDRESRPGFLIFNRTISLRDSWAKQTAKA
jgi:glutaminyl-tRNA synthetase